jgi:hypothetical protein
MGGTTGWMATLILPPLAIRLAEMRRDGVPVRVTCPATH